MAQTLITEGHAFASSVARRQQAHLAWSLGGVLVIGAAYGLGQWMLERQWVTWQFPMTVLWCLLPYLAAANWLYRGAGVPLAERAGLLIVTTGLPFVLTPLGFALLQQPYSRGAVLLVYLLSLAWFALAEWRSRRLHAPHLACLDASVSERLQALIGTAGSGAVVLTPWPAAATWEAPPGTIDGVVVDTQAPASEARSATLSRLKLNHVRLYSVETLAEMLSGRKMLPRDENVLWQLDGNPAYDVVKRVLDLAAVVITVPVWLPLCLGVALAVRLDSGGPVLFAQERVGRNGRCFRLWKFRSMVHVPAPVSAQFARADDPRITRVGRFIRRTRLDELPQLWNVLRGDMSLIGPRPEQVKFVESFSTLIPAYPYRHLVRPGLSGWAQVLQGYADDQSQSAVKLSYDLYYVAHYSMALDLLIAFKTVGTIFSGFGSR